MTFSFLAQAAVTCTYKCTQWSAEGARRKMQIGLEVLLETAGLEMMTTYVRAGKYSNSRRKTVPDLRSCNAAVEAPNEVQTNGTKS